MKSRIKDLIDSIKDEYLNTSDKVIKTLSGSLEVIQKVFPRYGSFIMEFIQNADDAHSKTLKFEMTKEELLIFNDGAPFTDKDIESICDIGQSSKSVEEYIGYLGIGFKSIFMISNSPEVHSKNFAFKFDKAQWPTKPWQILPIWTEENIISDKHYSTAFRIPLKTQENLMRILKEFDEQLNSRIILFLRSLNKIQINDLNGNERVITKSRVLSTNYYEIYKIQDMIGNEIREDNYWLIFREIYDVPEEIRKDELTNTWNRQDVKKREIIIALSLIKNHNGYELIHVEKGTAHIGVYSFLPIKEVRSGLNFIMQADFLTNPGRSELARECKWNNWLAESIFNTIINKVIPQFLKRDPWKYNFIDIFYSREGGHEILESFIKSPLRHYLEKNKVLISEDGSYISPEEAVQIDEDLRQYINGDEIEEILPGKRIIHPRTKVSQIYVETPFSFNASRGLTYEYSLLLNKKLLKKDVNFFKNFYQKEFLRYFGSSSSTLNKLKKLDLLLTEDFKLTDSDSLKINSNKIKIPNVLKGKLDVMHSSLLKDEELSNFFIKILNVEVLKESHIQTLLKSNQLPHLEENWENMTETKKFAEIKNLKELYDEDNIKDDVFTALANFITLKTKKGEWKNPEDLLFPVTYQPNHLVELLLFKFQSFLNEDLKIINSLHFLSEEFLNGSPREEIYSWYQFFKRLGVDFLIEEKKGQFSEDIGILMSLEYEKQKGRTGKVIGEKVGYDIEIIDEKNNINRYIEVKGRNRPDPDITLTDNEFYVLTKNQNNYFVYVVSNALTEPTLEIIKGTEILTITKKDIRLQYHTWNELKIETFRLKDLK